MDELVYLNGNVIPLADATISIMDYGFLFGYGLFETMRAYSGTVFRLDRHIRRLDGCARKLGILVDPEDCENAVGQVLQANGLGDARVRLTVSIGSGTAAPDPGSCREPTVLAMAKPYVPLSQETYDRGFGAIVSTIRRNSLSPVPAMKTANYLECLLARQEARAAHADDALLLNEKGQLAEASASNVFLADKNVVKTPPLSCGILPGIARETILELGQNLGIRIVEEDIRLEELGASDEAFLTNSLIEVMPLTAINGRKIGSGRPGIVTRRLMVAYKAMVAESSAGC